MEIPNTGSDDVTRSLLAIANRQVINNDPTLRDKVALGMLGYNYVSVIIPADREPPREVRDLFAALSDYPVLDDHALSELEATAKNRAWFDYGRREFMKEVLVPAISKFAEKLNVDLDDDDIFEVIDEDQNIGYVDSVWVELNQYGELTEHTGSEVVFNIRGAARKLSSMTDEEAEMILTPVINLFLSIAAPVPAWMI